MEEEQINIKYIWYLFKTKEGLGGLGRSDSTKSIKAFEKLYYYYCEETICHERKSLSDLTYQYQISNQNQDLSGCSWITYQKENSVFSWFSGKLWLLEGFPPEYCCGGWCTLKWLHRISLRLAQNHWHCVGTALLSGCIEFHY